MPLARELAPLTIPWFTRRAVLPILGCAGFALGLPWLVLVVRFNTLADSPSDEAWIPLLTATFLVGLPAALGLVTGETIHELLRHSSTRLLPGLAPRLCKATLLLASLVTLLVVPLALLVQPTVGGFGAVALSLSGFTAGTWVLIRRGGGALWALRWIAYTSLLASAPFLVVFLEPRPLLSTLIALAAVIAIQQRFHPRLIGVGSGQRILTVFSAFGGRTPLPYQEPSAAVSNVQLRPPHRTGGSLQGWKAARNFEQLTKGGFSPTTGLLTRSSFTMFGLTFGVTFAMAAGKALMEDKLPLGDLWNSTIALLADVFVGIPGVMPEADGWIFSNLVLYAGIAAAIQTLVVARPLLGDLLYPLSRPQRSQLAAATGWQLASSAALTTLILGGLIGGALWVATGSPPLERLPLFVWVAAMNLLAVPWTLVLYLRTRRLAARGHHLLALSLGTGVPAALATLLLMALESLHGDYAEETWVAAVVLYGTVLIVSLGGARAFVRRHFATIDLTVR